MYFATINKVKHKHKIAVKCFDCDILATQLTKLTKNITFIFSIFCVAHFRGRGLEIRTFLKLFLNNFYVNLYDRMAIVRSHLGFDYYCAYQKSAIWFACLTHIEPKFGWCSHYWLRTLGFHTDRQMHMAI